MACFALIRDLHPSRRQLVPGGSPDDIPSLVESREALRLFGQIADPDLRTAVRALLKALVAPATSADPNAPRPSAANRPRGNRAP